MPYDEDDLLPLSALAHLLFCQRRCALIHVEGLWAENRFTALGEQFHERAHRAGAGESRGPMRIARAVRLRSLRLGLSGMADVVEFHRLEETASSCEVAAPGPKQGIALPEAPGLWQPFPVEYKRGRPKRNSCDEVQLCAQALCLEEMLGAAVPAGALFYGATRRRLDVTFDPALRRETEEAAARLHQLFESRITPRAAREPKCDHCSLVDQCLPKVTAPGRSVAAWWDQALARRSSGEG